MISSYNNSSQPSFESMGSLNLTKPELTEVNKTKKVLEEAISAAFPSSSESTSIKSMKKSIKMLEEKETQLTQQDEIRPQVRQKILEIIGREKKGISEAMHELANTKLQTNIRSKNVQNTTIMPSEIRAAWASLAAFKSMNAKEQEVLSVIIAKELMAVLENPSLHLQEIHFNKKKEYTLTQTHSQGPSKAPLTFYIKIDPAAQKAIISINAKKSPESFLGKGGYKKVYEGCELIVPLRCDQDGRLTVDSKKAIARPKTPGDLVNFQRNAIEPSKIHAEIYERLAAEGIPAHITEPVQVREHTSRGINKQELIQKYYQKDLLKLIRTGTYDTATSENVSITFGEKLSLIEEIFETVAAFAQIGIVHRDIKPMNILLEATNDILHAYVHDFDLITKGALGFSDKYIYWDLAGQRGLPSTASDIVGAMLITAELLFDLPHNFYSDFDHEYFKQTPNNSFKTFFLSQSLNDLRSNGLPAPKNTPDVRGMLSHMKALAEDENTDMAMRKKASELHNKLSTNMLLLGEIYKVFRNEESWDKMLHGSCLCYYAGLSKEEYEEELQIGKGNIRKRFNLGVETWIKDQVLQNLGPNVLKVANMTRDEFLQQKAEVIINILAADKKVLREHFTEEQIKNLNDIKNYMITLKKLAIDLPSTGDPELFSLLNSSNPSERAEGQKLCYQHFGDPSALKKRIAQIQKRYRDNFIASAPLK